MTVTPVLFEKIEKFHCLNPSSTQGLPTGTLRLHVATCHVCENVSSSWCNFKGSPFIIRWWNHKSLTQISDTLHTSPRSSSNVENSPREVTYIF